MSKSNSSSAGAGALQSAELAALLDEAGSSLSALKQTITELQDEKVRAFVWDSSHWMLHHGRDRACCSACDAPRARRFARYCLPRWRRRGAQQWSRIAPCPCPLHLHSPP